MAEFLSAMRFAIQPVVALLLLGACVSASGQSSTTPEINPQQQTLPSATATSVQATSDTSTSTLVFQQLSSFKDSDIKFNLNDLMNTLSDRRHEGWVLAAYPDPKTSRPLIGAGFSLDLPYREHPQTDPLNSHLFVEPSSVQLWQAAGLAPERLKQILAQFDANMATWSKKRYRKNIKVLEPQITDDEATRLLRISAIQAIENAQAYCRNFDRLTSSQQMAVSQLVYQMGVNLGEFSQFLGLINGDTVDADSEYWGSVQRSLIESQWAKQYRVRAVAVIAMLDPHYLNSPYMAEKHISAQLHPAVTHRRRGRSQASLRAVSYKGRGKAAGRKSARARKRA